MQDTSKFVSSASLSSFEWDKNNVTQDEREWIGRRKKVRMLDIIVFISNKLTT